MKQYCELVKRAGKNAIKVATNGFSILKIYHPEELIKPEYRKRKPLPALLKK